MSGRTTIDHASLTLANTGIAGVPADNVTIEAGIGSAVNLNGVNNLFVNEGVFESSGTLIDAVAATLPHPPATAPKPRRIL
ncbi:hypothetical protein [Acidiphilium iwatense]|uniref:Uncharacterized protein n=1 Tax=Acidiphilium iwatense TaxID=768198 RepID=A0ABS9DVG3_9PROT|nr:hypothetical protein [Acidiphilium iwatense]MCF3945344.1 hypothetical protein [Acidiphilium iwatense]